MGSEGGVRDERVDLGKRAGNRFRCRATVERFGTKRAYKGPPIPTILLRDVSDVRLGTALTDHLWFTQGKWSERLSPGDTFEFDGRVGPYTKGYRGRRDDDDMPPISRDWRLERPTKVTIVSHEKTVVGELPLFAQSPRVIDPEDFRVADDLFSEPRDA